MSIPSGRHEDWVWPLKYIPRSWTSWSSINPPRQLLGSSSLFGKHLDITEPGTWAVCWPLYVTFRTKSGWHFRSGLRYDYEDQYYTFVPITIKKLLFKQGCSIIKFAGQASSEAPGFITHGQAGAIPAPAMEDQV